MQAREESRAPVWRGQVHGAWWSVSVPVVALATLVGFGVVQQQSRRLHQVNHCGRMSRASAESEAEKYISGVTGNASGRLYVSDATPQQGVLLRQDGKKVPVQAWFIMLQSPDDDPSRYLVRINAQTGQVYGMNTLVNDFTDTAPSSAAPSLLTQREAELRARQCLQSMGVPLRQLVQVQTRNTRMSKESAACNFVYRRRVPGFGVRTLMVCINRQTALPENVWNPVAALTAL